ncbi:hypothetical protein [Micromonospora zhanjiangensis]
MIATLLVVGTVGCDAGPGATTAEPDRTAALTYGTGPVRDGSVTYQPDVVLVEGGPAVIRSASGNGLTWTIDGRARGADGIAVGRVVYVTSRAVGRVVDLRPVGGDLAVTLAPVTLTEVFRDAHFTFDREVDEDALRYQEVPDPPGAVTVPTGAARSDGLVAVRPIRLAAPGGDLPPVREGNATVGVAGWEAQPYRNPGVFGLKFGRQAGDALKVFVDVAVKTDKPRVRHDVRIAGGLVDPSSTVALDGLRGIAVSISAGAANGADDNRKIRFEVPIEMTAPVPGTPFAFSTSWKIIVATALSGRNTTVTAGGEWRVDGAVGLVRGKPATPGFSVTKSILDSIGGLSVGVSGVAVAIEFKVQLGVGVPGALAGPYVKLVVDVGVTNGSALGAPVARCVGATLDGRVGAGVGMTLSSTVADALAKLLRKAKLELEKETLYPFVHKQQVRPDVPLCRA